MADSKKMDLGNNSKQQRKVTHQQVVEACVQRVSGDYVFADISEEEWREVQTSYGTYRIMDPVTLIVRRGDSTHRVVGADGVVHCYAAPETGMSILRWKARDGAPPVRF